MSVYLVTMGLWTLVCAVAFLASCCEAVAHFSEPLIERWQSGERPWPLPEPDPVAPTLAQEAA